jgi:hypothetical protein
MAAAGNAAGRWSQLNGQRRGFIRRCETYAGYTLPKICTPEGYKQENDELSHDFQSVGAQAVNHLANKVMLALFAPSRPFFRLDATPGMKAQLSELRASAADIEGMMAQAEKEAVRTLDRLALRPKLYEGVKHLIVTGNVLLCLEDGFRVVGLKRYCARRSTSGKLLELLIADPVQFDELDEDVQAVCRRYQRYQSDHKVTHYRWITRRADGDYVLSQWVDNYQLPKEFAGKWPEDKLPYRVLTWDLSDDAHYGTGLVEDYKGDFAGLSALSKSQVMGAVLASEFRWLVNPAGMTKPEDLQRSPNGAALPGNKDDVVLVESGKSRDLQVTLNMTAEYVNRIGRGFLLGATQIRNAERVTREEILLVANELETSLGGAYSRLAADFQLPLAYWLMALIKLDIDGSGFVPSVVTGLEALSRTGDLEDLKLWLGDMAAIAQLPPTLQATLKMRDLAVALAAPRRVDVGAYLKSDEQIAQEQAAARQAEMEQTATEAGITAAVDSTVNQGNQ